MSEMLNPGEVKSILGVSYTTLTNWRLRGILIPDLCLPTGRYKYSREQIEQFRQGASGTDSVQNILVPN